MIHDNSIFILLFLLLVFTSCHAQGELTLIERKDVNGVVFERRTVDTAKQLIMSREYFLSPDSTLSLSVNSCTKPKMCYPDSEFEALLEDNLKWPQDKEVVGDVVLSLLISAEGSIIDSRVVKEIEICSSCSKLALDFLRFLQCWQPAQCAEGKQAEIVLLKIPFRAYPGELRN